MHHCLPRDNDMVSPSVFRRVMFPIVGPTTAGGFSSQCSLSSNSNFVIGHPLLLIKREDFIDIFEIKHVGGIELLSDRKPASQDH